MLIELSRKAIGESFFRHTQHTQKFCWLRFEKHINKEMFFGQVEIQSKDFNSVYEVTDTVDLEKIRVSEGVVANKHDTRYTVGYEVEPGRIIPLYIKTPKNCFSSGVSQYNEASAWKMGFNVSEDKEWVSKYE